MGGIVPERSRETACPAEPRCRAGHRTWAAQHENRSPGGFSHGIDRPVVHSLSGEPNPVSTLARVLREVPFYARRAAIAFDAGLGWSQALHRVPLLTKPELVATLPKQWFPNGRDAKAELSTGDVELVESPGTIARVRICREASFWGLQRRRALEAVVDRSACDKQALLTVPRKGLGACHSGDPSFEERLMGPVLALNTRQSPAFWLPETMTQMLDELARHETGLLEGDPAYIATLALHATQARRKLPVRAIVAHHGLVAAPYRRAIADAFDGPLVEMLTAMEVGTLFVRATTSEAPPAMKHVGDVFVEWLPLKVATPGANRVAMMVVTHLATSVQPLVRYVLGDLAQRDADGQVLSIEGRWEDALVTPDGALVTAGAIDRALADVPGIVSYQANQSRADTIEVDVMGDAQASRVEERLAPLFAGCSLAVRKTAAWMVEASGRVRTARRHMPIEMARFVEGFA